MKSLSPSTRRLLELARRQDEPDPATLHRLAEALNAKIAQGASLAKSAQVVGSSSIAVKSLSVVVVASALAGAGWVGMRATHAPRPVLPQAIPSASDFGPSPHLDNSRPSDPSAASQTPEAPEPAAASPHRVAAKLRVPRRPTRANAEPVASAAAPTVVEPTDELRAETAALRLAEEALRDGSPGQALSLLEEQDARFGHGRLQQERAAARVLVLCQQGRVAEARAQAARFEGMWPHSGLRARIQSACWAL